MKKKVLMAIGLMLMCGIVGCGSKEVGEKETLVNHEEEREDSVDKGTKNPYKEVKMSENILINATSLIQIPEGWVSTMGDDFCYTEKGKLFMFTNDAASSFIIESCKKLEEMPDACVEDIKNKMVGNRTVCGYGSGSELSFGEQEAVTINGIEMLKTKGHVRNEEKGLEHNMIAYFTFHEPCQEKTEPYPVYFAYFYPEGIDEEEMEAYAYESAATLQLTDIFSDSEM